MYRMQNYAYMIYNTFQQLVFIKPCTGVTKWMQALQCLDSNPSYAPYQQHD